MNVPAIRKALERMTQRVHHPMASHPVVEAVVRVGLQACEEETGCNCAPPFGTCQRCYSKEQTLLVIADILRDAGVEVGE